MKCYRCKKFTNGALCDNCRAVFDRTTVARSIEWNINELKLNGIIEDSDYMQLLRKDLSYWIERKQELNE